MTTQEILANAVSSENYYILIVLTRNVRDKKGHEIYMGIHYKIIVFYSLILRNNEADQQNLWS